jgi:F-type H+-transporting ATPase subunit b
MMLTLLALAQEGEHAGPMSPFEVNFGIFFWTWIVFVVLLYVLKRFAFPVIVKATVAREERIAAHLAGAETANREAQALLEENKRLLAEARTQAQALLEENKRLLAEARTRAQALVAEAKQAAEKERAAAVERTHAEQEALLDRAKRDIAAEKDRAVAALRREAVDLSLAAATRLIGERMDSEADRKLVTAYLSTLEKH